MSDDIAGAAWPDEIYGVLKDAGVSQICFVPDAGHKTLIERSVADNHMTTVRLTTEEEGVAMLAGSWLGGAKGALLMQSSGVGNCPNFLSLVKGARFPILMIVSMRGEYGEQNPWQYPMGQAVEPVLKAMGVLVFRVEAMEDLGSATAAALAASFHGGQGAALILSQKFLGAKAF